MSRSQLLSDTTIRSVKPGDPRRRLNDGAGLYLLLFHKGGSHGWRFDYTYAGARRTLSMGTYPTVGLRQARTKATEARELLAGGQDPGQVRKQAKTQRVIERQAVQRDEAGLPPVGSFEAVAREWFATKRDEWAPSYADKIIRRLELDLFPVLGRRPMRAITPPELLEVLRRIEARGVIETAHRALENCSQVFRYAIATGSATSDPGRDLKDALRKPLPKHFAAITDPQRLGQLLRACDAYQGTAVARAALRLAPMLMLRPGELRHARWPEFDLDAGMWTVPPERMKREKRGKLHGDPHLVPLPSQAVAALRELHATTGASPYVFRGERHHDRPMSENTINAALRAMGFGADEMTGHGFRATARTIIAERLGVPSEVIEAQLAHAVEDSLGRAYNRTEFIDQRRAMLQRWADYLDTLRQGAAVVAFPTSRSA